MATGICRNDACANARSAKQVERYPGAGEWCPECGEALEPAEPAAPDAPFGGLTALEALAQFDAGDAPLEPPPGAPRSRTRNRIALVAASLAVAVVVAFALLRPTAAQRPASASAVRVCRSTMTERFAADVVRAYANASGIPAARFVAARRGPCDVRFAAKRTAKSAGVVAHDGIVVVVNPQNPLTRLTEDDVRLIFAGLITDWSEFGAPPGPIVPIMPVAASDEAQVLAHTFFAQSVVGPNVRRLASSADVVRTVAGAGGRDSVAFVAFSAAAPAKVVALAPTPAPSLLSIAGRRYPLPVALTVESASRIPAAAGLAAYARSGGARALVLRDGFVPAQRI